MKKIHNKVDVNAYVINLSNKIIGEPGKKKVQIILKNLNKGKIIAIKFAISAKDSFGDDLLFGETNKLEIKKADLNIDVCKTENIIVGLENYDVKHVDVEILQIVFDNIGIISPSEKEYVDYEYDLLEESVYEEKQQINVMHEINNRAICYTSVYNDGWVCACGYYNLLANDKCASCNFDKKNMLEKMNSEYIMKIIEEREQVKLKNKKDAEKKKKKDAERREAEHRAEIERQRIIETKKRKRNCYIAILICLAIVGVIVSSTISRKQYEKKYGLSDIDKNQYDIAIANYKKIDSVVTDRSLKYHDIAEGYDDDFDAPSRLSTAEKNKDYLYLRGYYLASPFLFDIITKQFQEKYISIYQEISKLKIAETYYNYNATEGLYVKSYSKKTSSDMDEEKKIKDLIKTSEKYLYEEILNPEKVSIDKYSFSYSDSMKEKVYGIELGILFYDDNSIMYIGEFSNGKANGYGYSWYSIEDGGGPLAEGIFKDGSIVTAESHYGKDGNTNNIEETKKIKFEGDFIALGGFKNTSSSETVANQAVKDEENDKNKAKQECERYLTALANKQKSITAANYMQYPKIEGNYYYFSCTITDGGVERRGTVTVVKQSDGTFKADGLVYD